MDGLSGLNSDYIRSLPAPVKRRIKALKNLQKRHMELECNFHKEMHLLEVKYEQMRSELEKKVCPYLFTVFFGLKFVE